MPDDTTPPVKVFTAPPRPARFGRRATDEEEETERTERPADERRKRSRS